MNRIDKVEIEGFWETHQIKVDLFSDVTFFIGPNGTGKTTFINLLAAALTADFPTLDRIPFKKVTITLKSATGSRASTITVVKTRKKESPIGFLEYRIKAEGGTEQRFAMDDDDDALRRSGLSRRHLHDFYYRRLATGVITALADLVHVQWLSVHRTPLLEGARDERTYESSVDKKLESLSNELVRYFATFSKQKDEEVRRFQEYIFISLLERTNLNQLFEPLDNIARVNSNQQTIADIFRELHVNNPQVDALITTFFAEALAVSARKLGGGIPLAGC